MTTPFVSEHAHGLRLPEKTDAVLLGELIFVSEGGHFRLAAAVNQIHGFGAEAPRGGDHVDGGIARADAGDAPPDLDLLERLDFRLLDKFDRAINAVQIFAWQIRAPRFRRGRRR